MRDSRFPAVIPADVTVTEIDLDEEEFCVAGGRLTEACAVEYSQRAARGGRPSLTAPGKHSPMLNLRVSETMKADLERAAAIKGARQSDLVRETLGKWLTEALVSA